MGDPIPVTEEFLKNETNTEMDAIHPRFMEPQHEQMKDYETRNYYFCPLCNLYFAPSFEGLQNHFRSKMVEHRPYGSCFYCKGPVFEYRLDSERKIYHVCRQHGKQEPEHD